MVCEAFIKSSEVESEWLAFTAVKVDSVQYASLMCGDDRLMLDRVIDMPVYQDVLTWDTCEPGLSDEFHDSSVVKTSRVGSCLLAMNDGCGLLADS